MATRGSSPAEAGSPCCTNSSRRCWYSAVTPSSLNRAALVPKTGMSSQDAPKAARLRTSCRATSRRASSAPRRSNLLIATTSAKSSMSIFSNWEAAPYSGVITYRDRSTRSTSPLSPCPMPGVSTTIRSYPAARQAVIIASRLSGTSRAPRVARERKKTWGLAVLFIRIRSPSSAPPPRRRVGSIASTAMRSLSSSSSRKRRSSSSVSELFPEPPVPVMPRTGAGRALEDAGRSAPPCSRVRARASARSSPAATPARSMASPRPGSVSQAAIIELIIPGRPRRWPSCGLKIRTRRSASSAISAGTMTPPPPPKTSMSRPPDSSRSSRR